MGAVRNNGWRDLLEAPDPYKPVNNATISSAKSCRSKQYGAVWDKYSEAQISLTVRHVEGALDEGRFATAFCDPTTHV
jgi:hypothetical protein